MEPACDVKILFPCGSVIGRFLTVLSTFKEFLNEETWKNQVICGFLSPLSDSKLVGRRGNVNGCNHTTVW
jgi:hypothetical protein